MADDKAHAVLVLTSINRRNQLATVTSYITGDEHPVHVLSIGAEVIGDRSVIWIYLECPEEEMSRLWTRILAVRSRTEFSDAELALRRSTGPFLFEEYVSWIKCIQVIGPNEPELARKVAEEISASALDVVRFYGAPIVEDHSQSVQHWYVTLDDLLPKIRSQEFIPGNDESKRLLKAVQTAIEVINNRLGQCTASERLLDRLQD